MTKTTNYEISKKLAEIGFKAKANHGWHKDNLESEPAEFISNYAFSTNYIKAFDLETLLDALPEKTEIIINQLSNKRGFYLDYGSRGDEIFVKIKENESLADTAGRLIILLHEKNLIKF
jgi:hypothetical protein